MVRKAEEGLCHCPVQLGGTSCFVEVLADCISTTATPGFLAVIQEGERGIGCGCGTAFNKKQAADRKEQRILSQPQNHCIHFRTPSKTFILVSLRLKCLCR
eukprot:GHVL01015587.1.p1 GENE.GHVL01015587.1~~GHVL01015587.1.p1  ORF type:complete len:101 (-),score=7.63 GHVL01015587.1:99-401(-)